MKFPSYSIRVQTFCFHVKQYQCVWINDGQDRLRESEYSWCTKSTKHLPTAVGTSSGDFQSRLLSSLYLLSLSPLSSAFNSCIGCSLWSLLLNPRDIRGSIIPGQSLSGGHWVTIPLCYGDVSLEHRKIDHQFKLPLTFFSPAAV